MQQRPFGATGRKVAAIGQGTWNMERGERAAAIASLRHGLDLGMTHIDTAEMYGSGAAEEIVGEAIAGRRGECFLVSKVLPSNASRAGTIQACERSLKRLRVETLDCYLLHWRGSFALEETFAAFEELLRGGKILSYGVSNFDVADMEEALAVTGENRIACNQVLYHLQQRAIEHRVIPWCEKHKVAVVAYSPFGQGSFPSGKSLRVLEEIGAAKGATAQQVALAFLLRRPSVFAIPKAAAMGHIEDNAAAEKVMLNAADLERIEKAFPLGPKPRQLPML
jgi:diketogulonate reductase-like aldo/keto reductase